MDGAPAILLGLHGSLLRQACARTGEHFAGLSAAARMLRRRGIINNKMQKQLTHLDVAAAYVRHATMPLAARIEAELNAMLSTQHGADPEGKEFERHSINSDSLANSTCKGSTEFYREVSNKEFEELLDPRTAAVRKGGLEETTAGVRTPVDQGATESSNRSNPAGTNNAEAKNTHLAADCQGVSEVTTTSVHSLVGDGVTELKFATAVGPDGRGFLGDARGGAAAPIHMCRELQLEVGKGMAPLPQKASGRNTDNAETESTHLAADCEGVSVDTMASAHSIGGDDAPESKIVTAVGPDGRDFLVDGAVPIHMCEELQLEAGKGNSSRESVGTPAAAAPLPQQASGRSGAGQSEGTPAVAAAWPQKATGRGKVGQSVGTPAVAKALPLASDLSEPASTDYAESLNNGVTESEFGVESEPGVLGHAVAREQDEDLRALAADTLLEFEHMDIMAMSSRARVKMRKRMKMFVEQLLRMQAQMGGEHFNAVVLRINDLLACSGT